MESTVRRTPVRRTVAVAVPVLVTLLGYSGVPVLATVGSMTAVWTLAAVAAAALADRVAAVGAALAALSYLGRPLVPAYGSLFYSLAIVGIVVFATSLLPGVASSVDTGRPA